MAEAGWKRTGLGRRLLLLLALLAASPAAALPPGRWSSEIEEASARFGVPADWIRRVIRAESGGRTTRLGRPIVSPAGAMGLMQLMPGTWRDLRAALGLGADPHVPRDNILAGTFYLRAMYDRFGYPGLFAAYNAGPARYASHLATRRALPAETVAYVAKLTSGAAPSFAPAAGRPAMFVTLARAQSSGLWPAPASVSPAPQKRGGALFVALRTSSPATD